MSREIVIMFHYATYFSSLLFVICYVIIHTAGKPFNNCNLSTLSGTHSVCQLIDKDNYWNKCSVYGICTIYILLNKVNITKRDGTIAKDRKQDTACKIIRQRIPN